MSGFLIESHCIFPVTDLRRTADYYVKTLGFRAVSYEYAAEPHVCLYRDGTEIILLAAKAQRVLPNRELYGYGYDAYFITTNQQALQQEFLDRGATIVRPLAVTDYQNREFVIEDIDGRWIAFGIKEGSV